MCNGAVPDSWCALTKLRGLFFGAQQLAPAITALPECMGAWSQLGGFLPKNRISQPAMSVLRFHPQAPLVTVSFGSNQLYGEK
jgi:hypothetical protein